MSKAFTKEDSGAPELAPSVEDFEIPEGPRHITVGGHARLTAERAQLLDSERPRLLSTLQGPRSDLDRAEDTKRLAEVERRAGYLGRLLERLTVVPAQAAGETRIFFGAEVDLEDEDGAAVTYRLVGPDEVDVKAGRISVQSPVGKALLGRELGDDVRIDRPKGTAELSVMAVRYPPD